MLDSVPIVAISILNTIILISPAENSVADNPVADDSVADDDIGFGDIFDIVYASGVLQDKILVLIAS